MTNKTDTIRRSSNEHEPVKKPEAPSRQITRGSVPVFNDGLESLRSGDC